MTTENNNTVKQPKVVITPWRALQSGATLVATSVQTKSTLTLIPTLTARGAKDHRWTYPGLGMEPEQAEGEKDEVFTKRLKAYNDKQYDLITSFRTEEWVIGAVITAFDRECQDLWKTHQDEGKFLTAIQDESIQRTPKRLSVFYWKSYTELKKEIKGTPNEEQKATLRDLLLKYKAAQQEEMDKELEALEA
jgi:hypothetical protein